MATTLSPSKIFQAVGGVLTGGKAGTIMAAGGTQKVSAAVNTAAEKLGAKLGLLTGGTIFASLAKGAQRTDTAQADTIVQEETGYTLTGMASLAIVAVIAAILWLTRSK